MIVNAEGIPIRSTLKHDETIQYSALITQLAAKARSVVRDLDPQVCIFGADRVVLMGVPERVAG